MKRIICLIAIFALITAAAAPICSCGGEPVSATSARLYGDTDGDGVIGVKDYMALRLHLLGIKPLTGDALAYADADGDGSVKPSDYIAVRLHVLGIKLIVQPGTSDESSAGGESSAADEDKTVTIAYIPLDDRPVNTDRVRYLAASAGLTLLMPDADLYSTKLDGQPKNANGTQTGDRAALLEWLKSVEDEADMFVISLDQMLSGGLVGSRWYGNTDLSFEYSVADYLISLTGRKKVYMFDTVMRLASTTGFDGYGMAEYSELRRYGAQPRASLSGDALTVDAIIAGYRTGDDGSVISTTLTSAAIDRYFASRSRKLRLADYIFSGAGDGMYCFVGVDDSQPAVTVQTNEINYISALLGSRGTLFAGTDELGMMAFARLCSELYGAPSVCATVYGGGENYAADGFDIGTLAECLDRHFTGIGLAQTSSDDCDLRVLVLSQTYTGTTSENADKLISEFKRLCNAGKPAIIIDCSGSPLTLGNKLLTFCTPSLMLGYSSWNTAANAVGIALSQGVCRLSFLKSGKETSESREGFADSLTFDLCKDLGYKAQAINTMNQYVNSFGSTLNYYTSLNGTYTESAVNARLESAMLTAGSMCLRSLNKLSGGAMYGEKLAKTVFPKVTLSGFRFPWFRTFEATFDITTEDIA